MKQKIVKEIASRVDAQNSVLSIHPQLGQKAPFGFHINIQLRDSDNRLVPCVKYSEDYPPTHNFGEYVTDPLEMLRVLILAEVWPGPVEEY